MSTDTTRSQARHDASMRLAVRMANMVRTISLYPANHPAVDFAYKSVATCAQEVYAAGGDTPIHLLGRRLMIDRAVLRPPKGMVTAMARLADFLGERGCGGIWVRGDVTADAVRQMFELLQENGGGGPGAKRLNELLEKKEQPFFWLTELRSALTEESLKGGNAILVSTRMYLRGCRSVARLWDRGPSPTTIVELKRIALGFVELYGLAPGRLLAMVIEGRLAPFSLRHPVHMAALSVAIGHRIGMAHQHIVQLTMAAMLADTGLAKVPWHLRDTSAQMDEEERALVDTHPSEGVQALMGMPILSREARRWIRVTWEHDGSAEHLFARIVQLTDAYDMLTARTGHQTGATPRAAIDKLRAHTDPGYDAHLIDQLACVVADLLAGRPDAPTVAALAEEHTDPGI